LQADFILASQRARTRRAQWLVGITAVIVFVLIMLTVYAFQQSAEAKRQQEIARENAEIAAEEQARIAESP
jgi:uncharacterized protein YpmB